MFMFPGRSNVNFEWVLLSCKLMGFASCLHFTTDCDCNFNSSMEVHHMHYWKLLEVKVLSK